MFSKYFSAVCFLFLFSCGNSKRLSNQNLSSLYNTDETILHPQYIVYHYSDDSSRFYFSFPSNNLLFKKNVENIFESEVVLNFQLLPSYQSTTILDSGTIYLHYKQDSIANAYNGFVNFKMQRGNQGILKIIAKDLFRNQSNIYFERIKKKNPQSAQFYLLKDEYDQPLFTHILNPDQQFTFQNNLTDASHLKVRFYHRNFPLASPPFHMDDLAVFDFKADNLFSLKPDSNSKYSFTNPGIYHLQIDTSAKEGLTILIFENDFPTPASAEQLIESLRYLTTRAEYNKLLQSNDKKKAVDQYWLNVAGNADRARKLIREYYTRVQEANRLFTSYLEGWKTDRGMVYIIFGPPQTIYRDDKTEQWTYGSANNLPDIDFIFMYVNNPFTNQDYNLNRSPVYETPWYMAVDEWRNGRVVNEY